MIAWTLNTTFWSVTSATTWLSYSCRTQRLVRPFPIVSVTLNSVQSTPQLFFYTYRLFVPHSVPTSASRPRPYTRLVLYTSHTKWSLDNQIYLPGRRVVVAYRPLSLPTPCPRYKSWPFPWPSRARSPSTRHTCTLKVDEKEKHMRRDTTEGRKVGKVGQIERGRGGGRGRRDEVT